jgi:hypothetical protein
MKILRIFALVMVTAVGGAETAVSQSAAKSQGSTETLQAANDLFSLVSKQLVSVLASESTAQVWPSVELSLRARNRGLSADTVAQLRKEFEQLQFDYISESMKDVPAIYARYFSAEELHDIATFYRTQTGAKSMNVLPRIAAEIMGAVLPDLPVFQQRVDQSFNSILRQRGYLR